MLRLLNNGKWNKSPVLLAARRIMISGLGNIWPKKALGEFAFFLNGTSYDVDRVREDGELIIRISNITNPESPYIRTSEKLDERYRILEGDLLVSWSASFKSIIWPGETGYLNQHIFKVTEYPGNHRGFIRHSIEATFDELQSKTVGIGMMHIRRGDFLGHEIPSPTFETQKMVSDYLDWVENGCKGIEPPLPDELKEQRRIVARIEALAARVAEAQSLRREANEITKQLLASKSFDAFSQLKRDFPTKTFGSFSPHVTSGPRNWRDRYSKNGSRFYRAQDIGPNGNIIQDTKAYVNPPDFDQGKTALLTVGDLMIVITGATVGRVTVFTEELELGYVSQHVSICRLPQDKILPRYALWWLLSPDGQTQLLGQRYGQGKPGLNLSNIRSIVIPVPPLAKQQLVVAYLDGLQAQVSALRARQAETDKELSALMPSILDRAFKGEL